MRLFSVFVSFLAALVTVLLIFGCYKEQNAMQNNGGLEDVRLKTQEYRQQISALEERKSSLLTQKQDAEKRLELLQNRENYKTEPTAFLSFDVRFSTQTAEIIEILDRYQIKGTFFVIGEQVASSETAKATLRAAAQKGHKIGIRSYADSVSSMYKSEEAYFDDLYKCRDLIKEITGQDPTLVRMPGGTGTADIRFKNNTGNKDALQAILTRLEKEGYTVNDWTVNSQDTDASLSVDSVISQTVAASKKYLSATYKTNLILFTDTKKTVKVLPDIIRALEEQGYEFSGLPAEICITRQR